MGLGAMRKVAGRTLPLVPSGFQERNTHRCDLRLYPTGATVHHQLTTTVPQQGKRDHSRAEGSSG
jgi:hypothetical protein